MHALVFGKARTSALARMLLARADAVWMWPRIALLERRSAASEPVGADSAVNKLSDRDEAGAQRTLDTNGLDRLLSDGAALARPVANSLGIVPPDLLWPQGQGQPPRGQRRKLRRGSMINIRTANPISMSVALLNTAEQCWEAGQTG
jgi:hypothetical protein